MYNKLKSILRSAIIHRFALIFHIQIGKKELTGPRAAQVFVPYILLMALVQFTSPEVINWYDIVLIIGSLVLAWIGFDWLGFGYFELFPIKYSEFDDQQKADYDQLVDQGAITKNIK